MSEYSTKKITRSEAERLLREIYAKSFRLGGLTLQELENELDGFSYSKQHEDILGVLYNFEVVED